jgi:hypothetical protein
MTDSVSGLSAALYQDEGEEYVVTPGLGSNRDICFVSKNGVTNKVEIVVSGNNTPLSVSASAPTLTINSATNGSGVATSTAAQIVAAVNADADAFALFEARLPPGSTGAGVTGELAETTAANGLAFTGLSLVDSGDGLTWQAAAGSRYWDPNVAISVYDDGVIVAGSAYTVNHLQGKVTFSAAKSGTITVSGTRRSELAFEKILLLYDGKMKVSGKDIPTTNNDDAGWESAIPGTVSWEMSANAYYYPGDISLQAGVAYLWKIYTIDATSGSWIGKGAISTQDYLVADPNKAQERNITVKGRGELYPEA